MLHRFFMILSLFLVGTPSAFAQPTTPLPGWSPWQSAEIPPSVPYETGFSNGDALQSSAWGLHCTELAEAAKTEASYWYRVSDLVAQIGVGHAQSGCMINGTIHSSGSFMAVRSDLRQGACLEVNSDVGRGLVLRSGTSPSSPRVAVLPNGSKVRVDSLPHRLQIDEATGRHWLYVDGPQAGFVSVTAKAGDFVNLRLVRC